jgi:hypothetical protein
MKKSVLLSVWAAGFALCAGLGFLPEPEGVLAAVMTLLSVAFFVPPFVLLYQADKNGDASCIALIRNLAALSLLVTAVVLVLNFVSVMGGEFLGNVLYYLLVIVSSPMICCRYWALSLFLWACLLTWSRKLLKKR